MGNSSVGPAVGDVSINTPGVSAKKVFCRLSLTQKKVAIAIAATIIALGVVYLAMHIYARARTDIRRYTTWKTGPGYNNSYWAQQQLATNPGQFQLLGERGMWIDYAYSTKPLSRLQWLLYRISY